MKRQSSLLPYKNEIVTLRRQSPPVSYAEISKYLREKYQITVNREAIFKFIKACATAHKKDKNKSCKPCTYAHKIKLSEATRLTPVEVSNQLVLEQKTVTVPEPHSVMEQISTSSVSLVSKDIEQTGGGRLTNMEAKSLLVEKEMHLLGEREKRKAERETQRQREREEREAQRVKRESEEAEKRRLDEKARFAPENFIVADPDSCLPEDVIDKLYDMKCKVDIKTQRFYHTDMVIVTQARQLVKEYLDQKNIPDKNVSVSRIIF
jgi:hypothetical protein